MPAWGYLKTPPMIAAKKIITPTNSNPVTIFLFRVTLRGRRRRSNLDDRIHPALSCHGAQRIAPINRPNRVFHDHSRSGPVAIAGLVRRVRRIRTKL